MSTRNQYPRVRECTYCGDERLTIETEAGEAVCHPCIGEPPEDELPEGYDAE